ncbi:hypothetical protein [Leifsonia sp. 2MCAF36]|uniref:hypothetical protein n=1 Tax=Leifsonia sp. 2MCAF36 TaxID=3232988 RepID=UPI003F9781A9
MSVSERGVTVAKAVTRYRRNTIAANILVAIAALMLALMAAADAYLLTQWNFVARMFMLGGLLVVGCIPLVLVIIAVSLRPYWVTFIALGVVGSAILATLLIVWFVPDSPYPYPEVSWWRRGSS